MQETSSTQWWTSYINLSSSNPEKAIEIVNTANDIFIKTDEAKSAKARKVISFLDTRISSVRDRLMLT